MFVAMLSIALPHHFPLRSESRLPLIRIFGVGTIGVSNFYVSLHSLRPISSPGSTSPNYDSSISVVNTGFATLDVDLPASCDNALCCTCLFYLESLVGFWTIIGGTLLYVACVVSYVITWKVFSLFQNVCWRLNNMRCNARSRFALIMSYDVWVPICLIRIPVSVSGQ
jgi:hypothetical protein